MPDYSKAWMAGTSPAMTRRVCRSFRQLVLDTLGIGAIFHKFSGSKLADGHSQGNKYFFCASTSWWACDSSRRAQFEVRQVKRRSLNARTGHREMDQG